MADAASYGDGDETARQRFFEHAVQAAAQVRSELRVLAPDQASRLGTELDRLLSLIAQAGEAERQRSLDDVFELLSGSPPAQRRFGELLDLRGSRQTRGYGPLEGDPVSEYDRWLCSRCGYAFPVIDVEISVPGTCPNDGGPLHLVPANG